MGTTKSRLTEWVTGFRGLQKRNGERQYRLVDNVTDIDNRVVDKGWFRTRERNLSRDDVGAISVDLQSISFWYAREGMLAVWDGNRKGWQDIQRALLYRYWDAHIFRQLWPNGSSDIFQLSDQAHAFCHALVTGQDEAARWLGHDLYDQSRPGRETSYQPGRVENFAVWLYGQWIGDPACSTGRPLGAYQPIVDAWHAGGNALRDAVAGLLDWRLDHTNEEDPEDDKIEWGYDTQPYDFWPVEILALERIRGERSLPPVDWPAHALLTTPLARQRPPFAEPLPQDELVERVVTAVRKVYPRV